MSFGVSGPGFLFYSSGLEQNSDMIYLYIFSASFCLPLGPPIFCLWTDWCYIIPLKYFHIILFIPPPLFFHTLLLWPQKESLGTLFWIFCWVYRLSPYHTVIVFGVYLCFHFGFFFFFLRVYSLFLHFSWLHVSLFALDQIAFSPNLQSLALRQKCLAQVSPASF